MQRIVETGTPMSALRVTYILSCFVLASTVLTGCVSNRPPSDLSAQLSSILTLRAASIVMPCTFVVNNRDLWTKGTSDSSCIKPTNAAQHNAPVLHRLPAGAQLTNARAIYMNGVTSAYCLFKAEHAEFGELVIWDIYLEPLTGIEPEPSRASWFCHSTRTSNLEG